jgi:hypothetical protein
MEREQLSGRRRSGRNDGHIEQVEELIRERTPTSLWQQDGMSPWGFQLRHCSCNPSVGKAKPYHSELLHHLTPADLPRQKTSGHATGFDWYTYVSRNPLLLIGKCRLYLGQPWSNNTSMGQGDTFLLISRTTCNCILPTLRFDTILCGKVHQQTGVAFLKIFFQWMMNMAIHKLSL